MRLKEREFKKKERKRVATVYRKSKAKVERIDAENRSLNWYPSLSLVYPDLLRLKCRLTSQLENLWEPVTFQGIFHFR